MPVVDGIPRYISVVPNGLLIRGWSWYYIEALRWQSERVVHRRISPVCPLTCNAETGVIDIANQEGVDADYSSHLQYLEAVTSKRMEGKSDLHPS